MKKTIMISILSIMILGCLETIRLKVPKDKEFKLLISKDAHNPIDCKIKPDTDQFIKLIKLLDENKLNWKTEYTSIFPRVSVSNSKLSVFFSGNLIVTNIGSQQYSHKIKESDYAFLNCD